MPCGGTGKIRDCLALLPHSKGMRPVSPTTSRNTHYNAQEKGLLPTGKRQASWQGWEGGCKGMGVTPPFSCFATPTLSLFSPSSNPSSWIMRSERVGQRWDPATPPDIF